jgi:hypothetical protein
MGAQGGDHGTHLITLEGPDTVVDVGNAGVSGDPVRGARAQYEEHILNVANLAVGPRGATVGPTHFCQSFFEDRGRHAQTKAL